MWLKYNLNVSGVQTKSLPLRKKCQLLTDFTVVVQFEFLTT